MEDERKIGVGSNKAISIENKHYSLSLHCENSEFPDTFYNLILGQKNMK